MMSDEGNDSLGSIIKQAIGKEPYLTYSRTGESAVKWMQSFHIFDKQDLPTWPLLTYVKMQKCDKCPLEFCSNINQRRHNGGDHGGRKKADSSVDRSQLQDFWDKLSLDVAKKTVDIKNDKLEGVTGSAIIKSLSPLVQKEGLTLPNPLMKAGSSLLNIVQGKFELISSKELFRILDDASEKTFLHGKAESVQKYVFNVGAWKTDYKKNVVTSVACASFLVEQKLVKAFYDDANLIAEAIGKSLVKEVEAENISGKPKKKKSKKAKTKTIDPSDVQRADRDEDVAAEAPSGSGNGHTEAGIAQNVEGGTSLVTSEPTVPQVQKEVEENAEMRSTIDIPKVGPPAETTIPGDIFGSESRPDHVPAKIPLSSGFFTPAEPGTAQNVEGEASPVSREPIFPQVQKLKQKEVEENADTGSTVDMPKVGTPIETPISGDVFGSESRPDHVPAKIPLSSGFFAPAELRTAQNVEGEASLVTSEPIYPQVQKLKQKEVEENADTGSTVDMPTVGTPTETPISGDVFGSESRPDHVPAKIPLSSGFFAPAEPRTAQNVEGESSPVTREPIYPQVQKLKQKEVEENADIGSTVDIPKVGPPTETPISVDVFGSESRPDHVPAKIPLSSGFFAPAEPRTAQNVEGEASLVTSEPICPQVQKLKQKEVEENADTGSTVDMPKIGTPTETPIPGDVFGSDPQPDHVPIEATETRIAQNVEGGTLLASGRQGTVSRSQPRLKSRQRRGLAPRQPLPVMNSRPMNEGKTSSSTGDQIGRKKPGANATFGKGECIRVENTSNFQPEGSSVVSSSSQAKTELANRWKEATESNGYVKLVLPSDERVAAFLQKLVDAADSHIISNAGADGAGSDSETWHTVTRKRYHK